jgi:hypothetical protein
LFFTCTNTSQAAACTCNTYQRISPQHVVNHSSHQEVTIHLSSNHTWLSTWEIWCRQGRVVNQENLHEAEFMQTKFASFPWKISCKASWSTPQGSPRA